MSPRALVLALVLLGCGQDHPGGDDGVTVYQDDASDEAFLAMLDAADDGVTTSAAAATLELPANGSVLLAGQVPTFGWGLPAKLPHGVTSGTFVWLRLTGAGLDAPLNVVSIGTQTWTPTAAQWTDISKRLGQLDVQIVTAVLDAGVVREGPFKPATTYAFQVAVN